MKDVFVATLAVAFLSACAGSQSYLRILENEGAISVAPAFADDHDYVVSIRNVLDFGYDPDDKATRDRTALQFMSAQCPRARIVGENVIATGAWLGGRPSRTYQIRIRCEPTEATSS